jgi:hypothetical protein
MRHPFDGINGVAEATDGANLSRRAALGQLAAGAAGLLGLASAAQAQLTTTALGEEGGPSTTARGEEGGIVLPPPTTEPFGEEAGKVVSRAMAGLEDGGKPATTTDAVGEAGGPVATTLAVGEEGGLRPSTRPFGEEGGLTRRRGEDGGYSNPIVPVRSDSTELEEKILEQTWEALGDNDATRGVQCCAILYGDKKAIPLLKKKLIPANFAIPEVDDKVVGRLIAELDSDTFTTREKATAELGKVAPTVLPRLEKALKEASGAEQRMRLTRIIDTATTRSVQTQGRRSLEVLIALQSPAARELVEALAKGPEKEWLTKAAREAQTRLR